MFFAVSTRESYFGVLSRVIYAVKCLLFSYRVHESAIFSGKSLFCGIDCVIFSVESCNLQYKMLIVCVSSTQERYFECSVDRKT